MAERLSPRWHAEPVVKARLVSPIDACGAYDASMASLKASTVPRRWAVPASVAPLSTSSTRRAVGRHYRRQICNNAANGGGRMSVSESANAFKRRNNFARFTMVTSSHVETLLYSMPD